MDSKTKKLALIGAARQVLRNGFAILGIDAPESMERNENAH